MSALAVLKLETGSGEKPKLDAGSRFHLRGYACCKQGFGQYNMQHLLTCGSQQKDPLCAHVHASGYLWVSD